MKSKIVHCDVIDEYLDLDATKPQCGLVSIRWLLQQLIGTKLDLSNPLYQRLLVASEKWKWGIMNTVLDDGVNIRITQVHIRVVKRPGLTEMFFEMLDGQQRISAVLFYLTTPNRAFPKGFKVRIDGHGVVDLSGLTAKKLRVEHPALYDKILNYEIPALWYVNLSDHLACGIFKELNNSTVMLPQELRNATHGPLPTRIREVARLNPHTVFTISATNGKTRLKYFGDKFDIKNRMEQDQYLTEIIYMLENSYKKGLNQAALSEFVEKASAPGGLYSDEEKVNQLFNKTVNPTLNFLYQLLKAAPAAYKRKLTPMLTQILLFFASELKIRHGGIDVAQYARKFFDVYERWSDPKKKLWNSHIMPNKKPMGPFSSMFYGKNANAIGGICYVLNIEYKKNPKLFGVKTLDPKRKFSRADIEKKWLEQNKRCYYTGRVLVAQECIGDHYTPHSLGGKTIYNNLVVTDLSNNQKKLNIPGDDYVKLLKNKS